MPEEYAAILTVIGVIILIVIIAIAAKREDERRKRRLEAFCTETGFTSIQVGPRGCTGFGTSGYPESALIQQLDSFQPFGTGDTRHCLSMLVKDHLGRWEYLMTYRYSTGSGKNRTTHTYDVMVWQLPHNWPTLKIRPQGLFDNIGGLLGIRDIQFESDEFNRKMHVTSADPQFAYAVLHPEAMEMAQHVIHELWQFGGSFVVIPLPSGAAVERYPQLSYHLQEFLEMTPPFLQEEKALPSAGSPLVPLVPQIES